MLTYTLDKNSKTPIYEQLYAAIKEDVLSGKLKSGEKLPSKRSLRDHLGISIITIEAAYGQLADEGYIMSSPKKGYFVLDIPGRIKKAQKPSESYGAQTGVLKKEAGTASPKLLADFASISADAELFPFATWAKLLRRVISESPDRLLEKTDGCGAAALRKAIAAHLSDFRGMNVSAENIIIGAGTEYLYSLLIQLLGRDRIYCIEDPCYSTIEKVYVLNGACCVHARMDGHGIIPDELSEKQADIVHVSPAHHYPTGISMPASRRYELLKWVSETDGRFIIEDDYDSEFRFSGKPVPTLYSMGGSSVIYMNTFTGTLSPTIRISYMVLPDRLMEIFKKRLGFYSCTVSNFEQYTLAAFISEGYFEKHLNRARHAYAKRREALTNAVKAGPLGKYAEIYEKSPGLHFIIRFKTDLEDEALSALFLKNGIRIYPVSGFCFSENPGYRHCFILSYTNIKPFEAEAVFERMASLLTLTKENK